MENNLASFLWPIFLQIKYPIMKKKERNSTVKEIRNDCVFLMPKSKEILIVLLEILFRNYLHRLPPHQSSPQMVYPVTPLLLQPHLVPPSHPTLLSPYPQNHPVR